MDITFEELTKTTGEKIKFSFLVTLICFSLLYLLFPLQSYIAVMISLSVGITLFIFTFITLRDTANFFEKLMAYFVALIIVSIFFYVSLLVIRFYFDIGIIFAGIVTATVFFGIIYNIVYFFNKIIPNKKYRLILSTIFFTLIAFFYSHSYVIDEFLISFNQLTAGEESLISRISTCGTVLSAALFFLHNMQLKIIREKEVDTDSETESVTETESEVKIAPKNNTDNKE